VIWGLTESSGIEAHRQGIRLTLVCATPGSLETRASSPVILATPKHSPLYKPGLLAFANAQPERRGTSLPMQQLDEQLKGLIIETEKAGQCLNSAVRAWCLRKRHKLTENLTAARGILAEVVCKLGRVLRHGE
jgi:hypothetical protein